MHHAQLQYMYASEVIIILHDWSTRSHFTCLDKPITTQTNGALAGWPTRRTAIGKSSRKMGENTWKRENWGNILILPTRKCEAAGPGYYCMTNHFAGEFCDKNISKHPSSREYLINQIFWNKLFHSILHLGVWLSPQVQLTKKEQPSPILPTFELVAAAHFLSCGIRKIMILINYFSLLPKSFCLAINSSTLHMNIHK